MPYIVLLISLELTSCGFFVPNLPAEPEPYYDCELLKYRLRVEEPINDEIYFDFGLRSYIDINYSYCHVTLHYGNPEYALDTKRGVISDENPDECALRLPDSNLYVVFTYDKQRDESFVDVIYPDIDGEIIASNLKLACTYKE